MTKVPRFDTFTSPAASRAKRANKREGGAFLRLGRFVVDLLSVWRAEKRSRAAGRRSAPLNYRTSSTPVARRQLQLNVVRIAECQDVNANVRTQVLDLTMWHVMLTKDADRIVQVLARANGEAEMIEPDATLIEAIFTAAGFRIWRGPEAEEQAAVTE